MVAAAAGAATIGVGLWLFLLPHAAPASGPAISRIAAPAGHLAVVDGDTLRVGDQVVRLEGIAAPARGSACGTVDCGAAAANALAALVRGTGVDCTIDGHDGQGRPVAECLASGVKLNEALVRDGWAHAVTASLRATEAAARSAGRGIWRPGL
jgi:endonuclease YncB( thermonuclease family)